MTTTTMPTISERIDNRDTDGLRAIKAQLSDEDWVALLNHALKAKGIKLVREEGGEQP